MIPPRKAPSAQSQPPSSSSAKAQPAHNPPSPPKTPNATPPRASNAMRGMRESSLVESTGAGAYAFGGGYTGAPGAGAANPTCPYDGGGDGFWASARRANAQATTATKM